MAQGPITADMVRDAGIAASMAANPELLPEPSIYFQDFSFGKTMFEAAFGNAEALAGVGEAISDVAIDNRLKPEAEERKKDDPATDASMITELGARQREALAEMQAVSYSDGKFLMNGIEIYEQDVNAEVDATLGDFESFADELNLQGQECGNVEAIFVAIKAAENSPEEQARLFDQLRREHLNVYDRFVKNANKRELVRTGNADVEVASEASEIANTMPESVVVDAATTGAVERQNAIAGQINERETWEQARSAQGYANSEIDDLSIRQSGEVDELSALFNDEVSGVQIASNEADTNTPVLTNNATVGLG